MVAHTHTVGVTYEDRLFSCFCRSCCLLVYRGDKLLYLSTSFLEAGINDRIDKEKCKSTFNICNLSAYARKATKEISK